MLHGALLSAQQKMYRGGVHNRYVAMRLVGGDVGAAAASHSMSSLWMINFDRAAALGGSVGVSDVTGLAAAWAGFTSSSPTEE